MNGVEIFNAAGLRLDLIPGQNLVTEQSAPWLSDDVLPGEYSYPINAPLNDNNKRFVEHAYRPDGALPRASMPVRVQMEGVLYRYCTYVFQVQQGKLNGHLKIDSSEFYDRIGKMTLLEALPDEVHLGNGMRQVNGATVSKTLQQRLGEIVRLPPGEFPLTFFPLRNIAFWEEDMGASKVPGFVKSDYVNVWELQDNIGHAFRVDSAQVKGNVLVPFFYLSWVLERIMTLAGYRIESDWLLKDDIQTKVIVNMTAMNQRTDLVGGAIAALLGHSVTAGMHLPDMTVTDFLLAIKGMFGLVISFNANDHVCRITSFLDTVAAGPFVDLSSYQVGPYSVTNQPGKGYTVSEFVDSADELFKNEKGEVIQPVTQIIGRGEDPVQLRVGTTQLINIQNKLFGAGNWLVPTVSQPGNTLDPEYKLSERYVDDKGIRRNNIGLKLLSYRGITQDSKIQQYPLGTPDVRDGRQNIVGSIGLTLGGRTGRWRTELRSYFHFRDNTQVIKQPMLMPVAVLSSLPLDRTITLALEDQVRRAYLIQKITAESPGIQGLVMVDLEVLTLPTGLELPDDVDEPIVWVEWIVSGETLTGDPLRLGVFRATRTYTVKFWADRNRTTPAVVTNLTLTVRRQRTQFYSRISHDPKFTRTTYDESTRTYLVNGQTDTVEQNYIVDELKGLNNLDELQTIPDGLTQSIRLDPGEGYTII